MADNFDNGADEMFDVLRRMIEPANRFGESLVALTADMQSLTGSPQVALPDAAAPGVPQLGEMLGETATRNGQQEQLKLIGEQLAEQKRTNEHLQVIAEKESRDVLGP